MHWMLVPLQRYFDFRGRSRRMEFWMFVLFQMIVGLILFIVALALFIGPIVRLVQEAEAQRNRGDYGSNYGGDAFGGADPLAADLLFQELGTPFIVLVLVYLLWWLALFIPSLAVTIRRLHDSNRTGWWVLGYWIPYLISLAAPLLLASAGAVTLGTILWLGATIAFYGFCIVLLVFMCLDGTPGPNRFGPNPKLPGYHQTFA